jgi:uncharacterized protein
MSPKRVLTILLLMILLCSGADAQDASGLAAIPALQSHVNDYAGMLNADQRTTLDQVLAAYETRTGSQIVILLIGSTAPEAIEQYGIRVADAWKPGRAGIDDGVILIVAKNNPKALRRLRIEAGRGVQGSLTDAQSKRVLEDVIAPHFRQEDYYGGLSAGVAALTALLDREQLPAAQRPAAHPDESRLGQLLPLLFFAFVVGAMLLARSRSAGRRLSANSWGNTAGVVIGSILSQSGRGGHDGGFGAGGGGFSGGGGGFDGGGASGDW